MKILIADKVSLAVQEALKKDGHQITFDAALKDDALEQAMRDVDPSILVVRSTKVTKEIIEAGTQIGLVIRAGAGVNTIDLSYASQSGVFVANCPGKNAVAVAELAMGLIHAIDRSIPDNVIALREGKWKKKKFGKAEGLKGKTLGLIGSGSIALEVASRARAYGIRIAAWSRSLTEERAEELDVEFCATPNELARMSDIVSVHLALTDETRGFCNSELFSAMNEGAYFINTSRGEVVDEDALLGAIEAKQLRCGLDVYQNEPSSGEDNWQSPLASHPAVYGTHHIGASTAQAEEEIGKEVRRIIQGFTERGEVLNCVNLMTRFSESTLLSIRHKNEVGVLASVLDEIKGADINVLKMSNLIFDGGAAACAQLKVSEQPANEILNRIKANAAVISVAIEEG